MTVFELAVILEIILINLFIIMRCASPRYKPVTTLLCMLAFTAPLIPLGKLLISALGIYGTGNGLFALLGFAYLLPGKFLFRESATHLAVVLCSVWVYTLGVFSVSVQTAKLFPQYPLAQIAHLVQTIAFCVLTYPALQFISKRYLYILQHLRDSGDAKVSRYLKLISAFGFCVILLVNIVFSAEKGSPAKVLVCALLVAVQVVTYDLLYQFIQRVEHLRHLQQSLDTDFLTGLRNRRCFTADLQHALDKGSFFTLFFMDLNRFKSVNDHYGHDAGDRYLQAFAKRTAQVLSSQGRLYRLSGDEFAALYTGLEPEAMVARIHKENMENTELPCPFLGVSIGCEKISPLSHSAEQLLRNADNHMYAQKRKEGEAP